MEGNSRPGNGQRRSAVSSHLVENPDVYGTSDNVCGLREVGGTGKRVVETGDSVQRSPAVTDASLNKSPTGGGSVVPTPHRNHAGQTVEEFFENGKAEVPSPGPIPSNTGPGTRQGSELGGIDCLRFHWFGIWAEDQAEDLFKSLERAKSAAAAGVEERATIGEVEGAPTQVRESGARVCGNTTMPFIVVWQGLRFLMRRPRKIDDQFPAVVVELEGTFLTELGHQVAVAIVRSFLKRLGFITIKEQLTRVDVCADLLIEFAVLRSHFDFNEPRRSRVVSRTGNFSQEVNDWESSTVYVKSTDLLCRIYDKLREASRDPLKLALMKERRWGGEVPRAATRVEFQMTREVLRDQFSRSIDTYEDLIEMLAEVIEWLTTKWLRLVDEIPDRENRHQDRCKSSRIWEQVRKTFAGWVAAPGVTKPRKERLPVNLVQLAKQLRGVATSLAARSGAVMNGVGDWQRFVGEYLLSLGGQAVNEVRSKTKAIKSAMPSQLLKSADELARERLDAWMPRTGLS